MSNSEKGNMTPEQICRCGHPKLNHVNFGTAECDCGCPCGEFTPEQIQKHTSACAYMLDNQFACDCGFDSEQLRAGETIPDDLKMQCPLCLGKGIVSTTSFGHADKLVARSCHTCKGNGWMWALTLEEMAERIGKNEAENRELREFTRLTNESIDRAEAAEAALKEAHHALGQLAEGFHNENAILRAQLTAAKEALRGIYEKVTNGRLCFFGGYTGYESQFGSTETERWKAALAATEKGEL